MSLKHAHSGSPHPHNLGTRSRRVILETYFERGFPYSRKLTAHSSCVNALAFSSGGGRWLASAGDDRSTYIWDLHQENVTQPSTSFYGHRANVFTVAFSASNRYVFSGGADEVVFKYDFAHDSGERSPPTQLYTRHNADIRAISCHPSQDEVFLSASQDGTIMLHDGRAKPHLTQAQATIQHTSEFSGVQYHPTMEDMFVTSDSQGNVCLRDVRMAFGPLHHRTNDGIVQTYVTKLARKLDGHLARPDVGSVTFDSEGKKLAVSFLHYLPTIYALSDPYPLATCSGRYFPDGNPPPPGMRTFSNSATIKHGSFGGPGVDGDGCYSCGSDDFRGYVWKVPPLHDLERMRAIISAADWSTGNVGENTIAFTDPSQSAGARYVPPELSTPLCHLTGHKSIINTTLIHPIYPLIMTSGIERHVFMHSATAVAPCSQELTPTPPDVRELPERTPQTYNRILRVIMEQSGREEEIPDHPLGEDGLSISFFDEILRQEGEEDVFASRGIAGDEEEEEEEKEEEDSMDVDVDSVGDTEVDGRARDSTSSMSPDSDSSDDGDL